MKWRRYPPDVLPAWVAETDFPLAPSVRAVLQEAVARDDTGYVNFMLRDALAIAERTGSAIVVVHARKLTFNAVSRFADRARRDGADIVALTDLDR